VANARNASKFLAYCAASFGKGMSDDRFCAQILLDYILRYMALNGVSTSLSICDPNVLEHKLINSVVGVVEISVNLLLLPVQ